MPGVSQSRAFVDHLCAAHGRLEHLRHSVADFLQRLPPGSSLAGAAEHLGQLHAELVDYFRQEEEGGYLEEGVFYCPRLGQRLTDLQRQHGQLVKSLEHLVAACTEGSPITPAAMLKSFSEWSECLQAHAQLENELIAEAFGQSLPVDEYC
jgi:hypothetical protein